MKTSAITKISLLLSLLFCSPELLASSRRCASWLAQLEAQLPMRVGRSVWTGLLPPALQLNQVIWAGRKDGPGTFFEKVNRYRGVQVRTHGANNIPKEGQATVVIANHAMSMADGTELAEALERYRSDILVVSQGRLSTIPEFKDKMVFLDVNPPSEPKRGRMSGAEFKRTREARREQLNKNRQNLERARQHLNAGGLVVIFPSGVAGDEGLEWKTTAIDLARSARATILPTHLNGTPHSLLRLSRPWISEKGAKAMIANTLRPLVMSFEYLNPSYSVREVRFGRSIPFLRYAHGSDREAIEMVRQRVKELGSGTVPLRPMDPIAKPVPKDRLSTEIAELPPDQLLIQHNHRWKLFFSDTSHLPKSIFEIGRLRESIFRATGEGSGFAVDLDEFDPHYKHLVIWDEENSAITGSYRVGDVESILAHQGLEGLYSASMFNLDPQILPKLQGSLELGRVFVLPEFQGEWVGLPFLFKGLGQIVSQGFEQNPASPRFQRMIGTPSIPWSVSPTELNGARLEQMFAPFVHTQFDPELARFVRAAGDDQPPLIHEINRQIREEGRIRISSSESSSSASLPGVFAHYHNLGARIVAFHYDPTFNSLDAFIILDVKDAPLPWKMRALRPAARDFFVNANRRSSR